MSKLQFPYPLRVETNPIFEFCIEIWGQDDCHVADMNFVGLLPEERKPYAQLIVERVNGYDALQAENARLREALEYLCVCVDEQRSQYSHRRAAQQARQVLARESEAQP